MFFIYFQLMIIVFQPKYLTVSWKSYVLILIFNFYFFKFSFFLKVTFQVNFMSILFFIYLIVFVFQSNIFK